VGLFLQTEEKGYWDRIAERAKSEENIKPGEGRIPFKNWVAEYTDTKAKNLLLETFERFIALDRDAQILDVGCGPGKWTRLFAKRGFPIIGIDRSSGMIELAKGVLNENESKRAGFYVMDASTLGFRDSTFDFVNCVTVLQHVKIDEQWRNAIKEIVRVTKCQGCILLYETAPYFALKIATQSLRIRTLREYQTEFADAGARLIYSLATDLSFPLTFFALRKFSTTFNKNEAYFYWAKKNKRISLERILSMNSRIIAEVAEQIDYKLGNTPLGMFSPLRIMLLKKAF